MTKQKIMVMLALVASFISKIEGGIEYVLRVLHLWTSKFDQKLFGESRASRLTGSWHKKALAGELGIFGVLVFGAIALVVVSIILLFGMDIAGEFADGINVDNDYSDEANDTVNSTGNAFQLFGTSVLVIPAAAVLTVLIGGLLGAVMVVGQGGGQVPGMGNGGR